MILQSAWQKPFDFLGSKPIVVEPVEEHLTSDAGLLPIRQFDEQIGLTAEFAAALRDPRCQSALQNAPLIGASKPVKEWLNNPLNR
jgi:hypothetical protein